MRRRPSSRGCAGQIVVITVDGAAESFAADVAAAEPVLDALDLG
jgi:hypothetical protein